MSKNIKKTRKPKTPYSEATDEEKIHRNWTKAIGLFRRGEYSVSILRCATCLELAVNFAIRQELIGDHSLPPEFVNKLLHSANGIHGKFNNIYLPIMLKYEEHDELKKLWGSRISPINSERNKVAHSGEFRSKPTALKVMKNAEAALGYLLDLHGCEKRPKELPLE